MDPRLFSFVGGTHGSWEVISTTTIVGQPLPAVARVDVISGGVTKLPEGAQWTLRGITSNDRYTTQAEKQLLIATQQSLGRPTADQAAFIPMRKSPKWWTLTQDQRRAILEERSRHIAIGVKYLPAIARRLHHCRDLSDAEPFDFLTLFDFSTDATAAFDDLLAVLRGTEEWTYVEREVEIRLVRRSL